MRDNVQITALVEAEKEKFNQTHKEPDMDISENGINFIKRHEGCVLNAYLDSGGLKTIGYGHTGSDFDMSTVWTQEQADKALTNDLVRFVDCVNECVDVDITQNQFDALCSFCFNLGCSALRNSTLLRLLNNDDYQGAAGQFERWDRVNGKENAGILKRRHEERDLFLEA